MLKIGNITMRLSNSQNLVRQFSKDAAIRSYKEIKIPVPWGHISGKWWGRMDKRPILTTHGWQENSGSFDPLVQLLPADIAILAIDFPGHGLSSRLPPGSVYHAIDNVITVKRIIDYFKWPKVAFMGHSMGSIINFTYTMLYPDKVEYIILLEGFKPLVPERTLDDVASYIDDFFKYDNLLLNTSPDVSEPKSYEFEELVEKIHQASRKSVSLDAAKFILRRNVRPSRINPGKYFIGRDPRTKMRNVMNWSQDELMANANRVQCPTLFCRANRGPYGEKKENLQEFVDKFRASNPLFEHHVVKGSHHVHLNDPLQVSELVRNFIEKCDQSRK